MDRLIEEADRFAIVFEIAALEVKVALEISIMCFYTFGRSVLRRLVICRRATVSSNDVATAIRNFGSGPRRCL